MATLASLPFFLQAPGNPPMPWSQWRRMFETYNVAANLGGAAVARKRAILQNSLGAEGQRLYYTLPNPPPVNEEDDFAKALRQLDLHFTPTVNVVAERYRFRQRAHLPGESIEDYVAALRQLRVTCGWDCDNCTTADDSIRDQIVEKTNSPQVRERLLLEGGLTLERTVQLASQVESAIREAKSLATVDSATPKVDKVYKKYKGQKSHARGKPKYATSDQTQNQKGKCYRCGSSQHMANSSNCPAKDKKCSNCHIKGHFAKVCRQQYVHYTEFSDHSDYNSDDERCPRPRPRILATYVINRVQPDILYDLEINGVTIPNLIVDTASDASLLNVNTYDQCFVREAMEPCTDVLISYTSKKIELLGILQLLTSLRNAMLLFMLLRMKYPYLAKFN